MVINSTKHGKELVFNATKLLTVIVFSMFTIMIGMNNIFAADSVAQIFDTGYGENGQSTTISTSFNTQSFVQDAFTHNNVTNNERLYVNQTGMFKVSYSCVWNATSGGGNRRIYENYIRINGAERVYPSESDVYIRGDDFNAQAGGHTSSTSATLLVNLSDGDYIELRGGEDPADIGNGNTFTRDACYLTAQTLNTRAIEVFDGTGGQTFAGAGSKIVVNLDSTYHNGDPSLFELNADQVNVSEAGWYKVTYTSCIHQTTGGGGGQRESPQSWIRKNGNENISLSFSYAGYTRNNNADRDKNCNRANTLINLVSGDYIELQTGIFDTEQSNTIEVPINQSWLLMEKVELDSSIISINNSGQQIDHGVTAAVNFDINDKIGEHVTHTGSSSRVYFDKDGLYELAYNIGYQDYAGAERVVTCGELRKNGATILKPSRQCIYTRGDAQARTGTLSSTSIINVSKNDYVEILVNVIGESAGSDSENIQIQKGTTWFTVVKINETPTIEWDSNTFDLGDQDLFAGNLTSSINVFYTGEGQENIRTTCLSGDCNNITDDWTDGTDINLSITNSSITFTCSDQNVGSYSALYNINSTEFPDGDNITVTCDINQTYGELKLVMNSPAEASFTNVVQNRSYLANATVTCQGVSGSICGDVTTQVQYNNTGATYVIVPTSDTNPTWTNATNPQNCVLTEGQNCNLLWYMNMTGNIDQKVLFNINATANYTQVPVNVTNDYTINITVLPPNTITWDSADVDLGAGGLNLGNVTGSAKLQVSGDQTGINVTCTNGNCTWITDDWIDGGEINDSMEETVMFTCEDSAVGVYWAEFDVNSTEDNTPQTINVSCEITQTYGNLDITLNYPPEGVNTKVNAFKVFDINTTIICQGTSGAICDNISATPRYEEQTLDYGDASDGSVTITAADTILNNYTHLTVNANSGQPNITVSSVAEFAIGDEIMIVQMQDGGGTGTAGNYEFRDIINITGSVITVDGNLSNTYGTGTHDSTSSTVSQIVRVPQYFDITINDNASVTAKKWDGFSGGIVVIRAQNSFQTQEFGYVNVSHDGYRGGTCGTCGNNVWGTQGEGTSGIGTTSTGANQNGGGGGDAGAGDGSPGGGGGYGTAGTGGVDDGIYDSFGGSTAGTANLNRIFMGGGGGAGGDDNGGSPQNTDGAGIVVIYAKEIQDVNVHAIGERGVAGNNGVSGSGAGGTIWLAGGAINLADVNASGEGAVAGPGGDTGGAGGDGRIRMDFLTRSGTSVPSSGFNTSSTFTPVFGPISNVTGTLPFYILGDRSQTCPTTLTVGGSSCQLSWDVNVSAIDEITYEIDVNASTNYLGTTENNSQRANVTIDAVPEIDIITPVNNSYLFRGETLQVRVDSNIPVRYMAYYLNGSLSNETPMTAQDATNKTWLINISNLNHGMYNITFLYNESTTQQNTTDTHYFRVIDRMHRTVNKSIIDQGTNMYLVRTLVQNNMNFSEDHTHLEFVNQDMNAGSITPTNDFTNNSYINPYIGITYGWNLTLTANSVTEINYSISTAGGDYELLRQFMVGFE